MYLVFMKVVYWTYAPLIMDSLDVYQYAVRGRTTLMQYLNLVHVVIVPQVPVGRMGAYVSWILRRHSHRCNMCCCIT